MTKWPQQWFSSDDEQQHKIQELPTRVRPNHLYHNDDDYGQDGGHDDDGGGHDDQDDDGGGDDDDLQKVWWR